MGGYLAAKIGPLFVWQGMVLLALAVGAASLAYVGVKAASASTGGLADDEQLVPAQIGNIMNVVSTDGTLSFPLVETAVFPIAGTVGEVLVDVGDTVTEGQTLARLNAASEAELRAKLVTARAAATQARQALDAANSPPTELAQAMARSALAKANQTLAAAQDALNALLDAEAAQQALDNAVDALANARSSLGQITDTWDTNVDEAEQSLAGATVQYVASYVNWLGVSSTTVDVNAGPSTNLGSLGVNLDAVYGTGAGSINYAIVETPPDDPETPWNEKTVFLFKAFYPGSIVGTCQTGSAPKQGICVQLEMDKAWTVLQNARTALTTAKTQSNTNIATATNQESAAEKALAEAQAAYDALVAGSDSNDVAIARADVATARAAVDAASDTLDDLLDGPSEDELDVLNAALASAEATLEMAESNLAGAILTAPIGGTVIAINYAAGGQATGLEAGITIADRSVVEIAGRVDEIDILSIAEGDVAVVSLAALPGRTLRGVITEIEAASNSQGVVAFPITIEVEVPEGMELREGLSATASVVVSQQTDVLRVPTSAVQGSFFEPYVRVSSNGRITDRSIELGASDDFWVVVASGLSEGEDVVMPAPSASSTQQFQTINIGTGFGGVQVIRPGQGQGGGNFGGGNIGGGAGGGRGNLGGGN